MRLSGIKTKKDMVDLALREFARHRRIAALERYAGLAAGWDFDDWQRRRAARLPSASLTRRHTIWVTTRTSRLAPGFTLGLAALRRRSPCAEEIAW
jgi:Bacterial antitoxin of type II TA system, VapB